ncbi:peptigoglycan-binding protein LysM [Stutzerimonas stutzeri]|uniref:FimV/HubP family polar landmark protein n=1 Tax=Stutzerimonas sp. S1 TaxID=3030652 RepID=UPI002224D081|nr:FimV/HubP family polar landmark protein [Stutzerimonas sp. S1]MCW3148868.1 peptigoglycan-binding protein LysM [Stutzerimonas sp. S1]
MVRVRNLVLAIAAATALTTEAAYALGLGEVRLQSSLNQPLVAEIELLDAKTLGAGEVIPALASVEDFNRAGIDRQYFLTDLKFTPVLRPDGKSVIQISSSKPVREPYLNFLVEVLWPNGRLLREYTLLLDPPLYSPDVVAAVAPQLPIAAAPAPSSTISGTPGRQRTSSSPALVPSQAAGSTLSGSEYKTSARDTLWEIADRNRHGGSVHQAMLAIQDLNPGAFIDGNINRMKSGQVLRLPDANQVSSRTQAEAIAQVAQQNAAWRQARSASVEGTRQIDATRRVKAGDAPAHSESGDSLRLVAPDAGKSTDGSDTGKGSDTKALRDRLATTQESLDSSRRENIDLKERMDELQGQLEKLQRLMQLKDDQLAKLQAQLAVDEQVQPVEGVAAPVAGDQGEGSSAQEAGKTGVVGRESGDSAPVGEPASAERASERVAPASEAAKPSVPPAVPAKAKPAKIASVPEESSMLDEYLGNPLLLGILGGSALLLLLVGLMALSRRNAMKEAELQEQLMASGETESFNLQELQDQNDLEQQALIKASAPVFAESESFGQTVASTGDALAEADIYIAYGRFNQAAELLQNALNDEPQRSDLRLKLMEVYAELGDREGFARQETELREIGGASAGIEQLKRKYPAMVAVAAAVTAPAAAHADFANFDLDNLQFEEQTSAAAAGQDLDDAFDLSLDDLDIDLAEDRSSGETPLHDVSAQGDSVAIDQVSLEDLNPDAEVDAQSADDFSFELLDEPKPATSSPSELSDLSFDLGSDEETSVSQDAISKDFDFNFELDDAPLAPETAEEGVDGNLSASELTDDFDLSSDDGLGDQSQSESLTDQLDHVESELEALSRDLDETSPLPSETYAAGTQGEGTQEDDDFNFFSDTDEATTKLDLARAYIDMGDAEGARDILDEVVTEGSEVQRQEAREMLAKLA